MFVKGGKQRVYSSKDQCCGESEDLTSSSTWIRRMRKR